MSTGDHLRGNTIAWWSRFALHLQGRSSDSRVGSWKGWRRPDSDIDCPRTAAVIINTLTCLFWDSYVFHTESQFLEILFRECFGSENPDAHRKLVSELDI